MRNRWVTSNVLAGAASVQLFGARTDYRRVLAHVQARASAEACSVDQALKRHMAERMLGQFLLTGSCLCAMGAAALGAAQGWPDFVLVPLALAPATLMLLVGYVHQKASTYPHKLDG